MKHSGNHVVDFTSMHCKSINAHTLSFTTHASFHFQSTLNPSWMRVLREEMPPGQFRAEMPPGLLSAPSAPGMPTRVAQLRRGASGMGRWKLALNRVNESNYEYFAGFIPKALIKMIQDQSEVPVQGSFRNAFLNVVRQAVQSKSIDGSIDGDGQESGPAEGGASASQDSPAMLRARNNTTEPPPMVQRAPSLRTFSPRIDGTENKNQSLIAEQKQAVVLLVDISGFTRLSDKFQGLGQEGIDSLTSTINRMFSTIIEHVEEWNGDVIKFAGTLGSVACQMRAITPPCAGMHSKHACLFLKHIL